MLLLLLDSEGASWRSESGCGRQESGPVSQRFVCKVRKAALRQSFYDKGPRRCSLVFRIVTAQEVRVKALVDTGSTDVDAKAA